MNNSRIEEIHHIVKPYSIDQISDSAAHCQCKGSTHPNIHTPNLVIRKKQCHYRQSSEYRKHSIASR